MRFLGQADLKTILIPLDGSGAAETALPASINLARRVNASIHLVRVHAQLPLWDIGAEVVALSPKMERQGMKREEEYLETFATRIRSEGVTVFTKVVKGEIVPALRSYAATHGISLVVMTSHGWGGIRRAVLGSVADELIRTISIPVLIVTPRMAPRITSAWPTRILVPLDGSELAESVLAQVKTIDPRRASEILLTGVIQTVPPAITRWDIPGQLILESGEDRERQSRKYLEGVIAGLRAEGFRAYSRTRTGNKVAREILTLAVGKRCDLIVVATHGAGGIDRALSGSVADQVVRHSHIPILVVGPSVLVTPIQPAVQSRELAPAAVS